MDIRQLNYFIQVADCGSYSLASQKLYISQPALSKAIKSIEEEMGFSFFYTYQRRQKLTDEGKAFYDKAVKLLESYDELIKMTYAEAGIDKGHVNIGLSLASGPGLFAKIYPSFKEKYPEITISLMERETSILKEEVLKKNLDLAFIDFKHFKDEDEESFDSFPLMESDMGIVCAASHHLAKKAEAPYSALDGEKMILFNGGKEYAGQVEGDIKRFGIKPEIVFSSSQWDFILDMVAQSSGVVLCPYYIYRKFKNPKIAYVQLEEAVGKRTTGIIVRKGDYKTRACSNFLEFATDPLSYSEIASYFSYDPNEEAKDGI